MLYAKLIGGAAIALIIFLGYQYVVGLQKDNAVLSQNVAKLEIATEKMSKEKEQVEKDLEKTKTLVVELNQRIEQAEKEKEKVIKLFSDHDFKNLVELKPGLIEKRMNSATKKIFEEIENVSKE